jgi:hypothetical protein
MAVEANAHIKRPPTRTAGTSRTTRS